MNKEVIVDELKTAYIDQSSDPAFQREVSVWDITINDGIVHALRDSHERLMSG